MEATLDIFQRAGMTEIRNKSVLLTGYLEYLLTVGFEEDARLKGWASTIRMQWCLPGPTLVR